MQNEQPTNASTPAATETGMVTPPPDLTDLTLTPYSDVVDVFLKTEAAPQNYLPRDVAHAALGLIKNSMELLPVSHLTGDIITSYFRPSDYGNQPAFELLDYFFSWCHRHGYLPPNHPSPAASLITYPANEWRILTPRELRILLGSGASVDLLVYGSIASFAGIWHRDLRRTEWRCFRQRKLIDLMYREARDRARMIPLLPVLDAWLMPFYQQAGPVIDFNTPAKFYRFARSRGVHIDQSTLQNSFTAYRWAMVGNVFQAARETGASCSTIRNHYPLTSSALAEEYFSLTPEEVGIPDWPAQAAKFLHSQPGSVQRDEPED